MKSAFRKKKEVKVKFLTDAHIWIKTQDQGCHPEIVVPPPRRGGRGRRRAKLNFTPSP